MPDPVSSRELLGLFKKSPSRIVSFFRGKGYEISFHWSDVWQDEHARAFTVAKAMSRGILDELREGVDHAIVDGWSEKRFIREMTPRLKASGWWGKDLIVNPKTGLAQEVQLGSAWRLKTIYRTNTSTAFARGRYATQEATKARRPFWMYDSLNDSLTRQAHREMDNRVYRADDPIWNSIYPPNGFNCRCLVRALTEKQVDEMGLKVLRGSSTPPFKGFPDQGFDYNPGNETLPAFIQRIERPKPKRIPIPPRPKTKPKKAAPAPAPVIKKQKIYAPESLHKNGRPIVREKWVDKWVRFMGPDKSGESKLGTVPGFMKLIEIFDHPVGLKEGSGAFFRRGYAQRGGLNMGSHIRPGDLYDRSVFRHEMGHHLDERILRYKMTKGEPGSFYMSSSDVAQKALLADDKILNEIGKKTYKKTIKLLEDAGESLAGMNKRIRRFSTDNLDYAWYKRRELIAADLMNQPGIPDSLKAFKDAKAILKKDKSIIGKIYRAYDEAPKYGPYDTGLDASDILTWAEAAKGGELSILFTTKSRQVFRRIFKNRKWSDEALSDLFGAITNEDIAGNHWGYGHGKSYYAERKYGPLRMGQGTEAFANMTDLSVARGDELFEDILNSLVPNYSKWYDDLIAEILTDAEDIAF